MYKKYLLLLALLLALPGLASAWTVNSKTSPATGSGIISPAGNKIYTNGVNSGLYTAVPAAGKKISRVTIDGVTVNTAGVPDVSGSYTVPYLEGKSTRYLIAYFTASTIDIVISAGTGGIVREDTFETLTNIPVGSARQILIKANSGYTIDTVSADGATVTDNPDGSKTATYTNLQVSQTVSATFALTPVVTVNAGNDVNTTNKTGATATLYGSATSNQGAVFYAWTGSGLIFGAPTAAVTTVSSATPGIYTATLTVTSGAVVVSDTVTVTVLDGRLADIAICTACHTSDRPLVVAFNASMHNNTSQEALSCQSCHSNNQMHAVLPSSFICAGCHQPLPHGEGVTDCLSCHDSHSATVMAGMGCDSCHAFPPTSGAHVAHFGLTEASGSYTDLKTLEARYPTATIETAPPVYAFGCALCHSVDRTRHMNGSVDVLLYEAGAEAGSLKALAAPTAAYDPNTGICSGTYCHSTGQSTPIYQTTPAWASTTTLSCDACHGNPPAYPTGGAGAATANGHINVALDGWVTGHFSGIRGPWHTPQHGDPWGRGEESAPLTCQTCHYQTTDPANVGPSGFYWLDTTGNYQMPDNLYPSEEEGFVCSYCHNPEDPNGPVVGAGKVLPLRHINGKRDVIFDPRETLPSDIAWLPVAPNKPTRPVWFTQASQTTGWPTTDAPITWNGSTRSWSLSNATYDPATKTCSSTSCHVQMLAPVWGSPVGGPGNYGYESCCNCHTSYCF